MHKANETARTASRTTQNSAYTAMDCALKAQEMNTKLLQQTSAAWIEGLRYQAKLSQGMARVFFGQWGSALASTTHVALPIQRQSESEITVPATNDAQKATETAVKDAQKNAQKNEKAAEQTQKATETAANSAHKSTESAAEETQNSTAEVAAKNAEEKTKGNGIASKHAKESVKTTAFPIDGYDEMNVGEISEGLEGLSTAELKRVRKYEKKNKDRGSLRKEIKQKIETIS